MEKRDVDLAPTDSVRRVLTSDGGTQCNHKACIPKWDAVAARGMTATEIRKHFPRFEGRCPDCGTQMIYYACMEQYIGGDY